MRLAAVCCACVCAASVLSCTAWVDTKAASAGQRGRRPFSGTGAATARPIRAGVARRSFLSAVDSAATNAPPTIPAAGGVSDDAIEIRSADPSEHMQVPRARTSPRAPSPHAHRERERDRER